MESGNQPDVEGQGREESPLWAGGMSPGKDPEGRELIHWLEMSAAVLCREQ